MQFITFPAKQFKLAFSKYFILYSSVTVRGTFHSTKLLKNKLIG